MVSRNGRKQSVRQNGSHRQNAGVGVPAGRGAAGLAQARYAARVAARNAMGDGGEHSVGALDVLVGMGDTATDGRPGYSTGSPLMGNSLAKNLFIAGTPGVGKTMLLREVTLSKREHI